MKAAPALLVLGLVLPACVASRPPDKPQLVSRKVERACGLTAAPVTREQALCIAQAAGVGLEDGAYTLEEGTDLEREPSWILRERCDRVPQCVEIWIRRADGAIVSTRHVHAFEDYERLPRRR